MPKNGSVKPATRVRDAGNTGRKEHTLLYTNNIHLYIVVGVDRVGGGVQGRGGGGAVGRSTLR